MRSVASRYSCIWMKRARPAVVLALCASSKQHSAKPSNCLAKVALMARKQCRWAEVVPRFVGLPQFLFLSGTVGACGFLNLSPVGRPPRPITRAEALRDDPLNARFARMLEHYRAAIALGTFCAASFFSAFLRRWCNGQAAWQNQGK